MSGKTLSNKARTTMWSVIFVYALTVAVNLGEFWPFSIYPMFSQAGNPWSRSVVREVPPGDTLSWDTTALADIPGQPYGVRSGGVGRVVRCESRGVWRDTRGKQKGKQRGT